MTDVIACPACGTSNPASADWCNLCFATFDTGHGVEAGDDPGAGDGKAPEVEPYAGAQPSDLGHRTADPSSTAAPGEQLSLLSDSRQVWQCRFCDTQVSVEETTCPVCQQSIYDSFGRETDTGPSVAPDVALRWSALPGAGHFRVGQGVLGSAIALVITIGVVFGVTMLTSGRTAHGSGLVFMAVGIWLASVHDVYRISRNETDEILLRPRVISVIAGVIFMVIIAAAVSAQPAINQ